MNRTEPIALSLRFYRAAHKGMPEGDIFKRGMVSLAHHVSAPPLHRLD